MAPCEREALEQGVADIRKIKMQLAAVTQQLVELNALIRAMLYEIYEQQDLASLHEE